jgi:hypothetical protein
MSSTALSMPAQGLIPGANTGGWNIPVPYGSQQGGQASLGGAVNPFLATGGTGGSFASYPQGAVSTSATAGIPAFYGTPTSSPNSLTSLTGIAAQPNNPKSGAVPITNMAASLGDPTTNQGQHQLFDALQKSYGPGMATTLMNFLASGAGFNQDAVNNLIAALQPGFVSDQENLLGQFSAGGNRFSSGAQFGLSNLMGQQQLDVGQLETQMYEQSVNDYLDILTGTSSQIAQKGEQNTGGGLSGLMNLITGGSGAASALISAIDPNADTTILDTIAGL